MNTGNYDRRNQLKKFNDVYYNDNNQYIKNIKHDRLPEWMLSYGGYLQMEFERNLPNYYREFKQGTVVMTNYGVGVGSEMSFSHFSVVLNKNDDKFHRKLIVVPLSSKYHKGYVSLGNEIFSEALKFASKKIEKLSNEYDELVEETGILQSDMNKNIETLKAEIIALRGLMSQIKRYNKETFADISNVTTISKLRTMKFSQYNISENITLSERSLNKLRNALFELI